jgi:hypothetical protein
VRLWEIEAPAVLAQGLPGLAGFVPLMKGVTLGRIEPARAFAESGSSVRQFPAT